MLKRSILLLIITLTLLSSSFAAIERFGWNDRYMNYNDKKEFLVGFDLQQTHTDAEVDYRNVIDFLSENEMTKMRIWLYTSWYGTDDYAEDNVLHPWKVVEDNGKRKFDIDNWDPKFWESLENTVSYARSKGIIVEVTLFTIQEPDFYFRDGIYKGQDYGVREYAFRNINNIQNYGTPNSYGDFYPQFFDLNYAEQGKKISDYQKDLIDKTIETIGNYDNVYYELVNEGPGSGRRDPFTEDVGIRLDDDEYVDWSRHMSQYIKSKKPNAIVTVHAHGYGSIKPPGVSQSKLNTYMRKFIAMDSIDGLNFHWYASRARDVSSYQHDIQLDGKMLINNEGAGYYGEILGERPNRQLTTDQGNFNREIRHSWGHVMAGGYFLIYHGPVELFTNDVSLEMAQALAAQRHIIESIPNWWELRPVKANGNEYEEDVKDGPSQYREMMANPNNAYLVYYSEQETSRNARINIPAGDYDYVWYDVTKKTPISSGSATSNGQITIPAPNTNQWHLWQGLALIIVKSGYSGNDPVENPIPGPEPEPPETDEKIGCGTLWWNNPAPVGYGQNYDHDTRDFFHNTKCTQSEVFFNLGLENKPNYYVYNKGYIWKNNQWQEVQLTGQSVEGSSAWLTGVAKGSVQIDTSVDGYALGYICKWTGTEWKCGCHDQACTTSHWNLQVFNINR